MTPHSSGSSRARADELHREAGSRASRGDPAGAAACYRRAAAHRRAAGDMRGRAWELRHLGQTLLDLGELGLAEESLDEALGLYQQVGTTGVELANALRPMALALEARGRRDDALETWRRARDLYEAAGIDAGVAEAEERIDALAGGEGAEP